MIFVKLAESTVMAGIRASARRETAGARALKEDKGAIFSPLTSQLGMLRTERPLSTVGELWTIVWLL